uniref:Uncharacterized protein n=1 Tax=Oryza brachyantha TaxID=4533 RepID=J3LYY9_ORYBR
MVQVRCTYSPLLFFQLTWLHRWGQNSRTQLVTRIIPPINSPRPEDQVQTILI